MPSDVHLAWFPRGFVAAPYGIDPCFIQQQEREKGKLNVEQMGHGIVYLLDFGVSHVEPPHGLKIWSGVRDLP